MEATWVCIWARRNITAIASNAISRRIAQAQSATSATAGVKLCETETRCASAPTPAPVATACAATAAAGETQSTLQEEWWTQHGGHEQLTAAQQAYDE